MASQRRYSESDSEFDKSPKPRRRHSRKVSDTICPRTELAIPQMCHQLSMAWSTNIAVQPWTMVAIVCPTGHSINMMKWQAELPKGRCVLKYSWNCRSFKVLMQFAFSALYRLFGPLSTQMKSSKVKRCGSSIFLWGNQWKQLLMHANTSAVQAKGFWRVTWHFSVKS